MKFSELRKAMSDFNLKHGVERKVCTKYKEDGALIRMTGRVVIKNSALIREFPLENRTYEFSNYEKALTSGDLGYSIFAMCKADNDCMRIENMSDADFESAEIVEIVE